jgi:hypothetical protein
MFHDIADMTPVSIKRSELAFEEKKLLLRASNQRQRFIELEWISIRCVCEG